LVPVKIFDRKSNVRFHECIVAIGLQKSPVHDFAHSPLYINRRHPCFMKTCTSLIVAAALGLSSAGYSTHASDSTAADPNKAIYEYLGAPVAPPASMDAAYSKEGLTSAMQTAANAAGISLTKLEIDDSEFPFLVGVICASQQDMEKLKEQIRKLPAYNYTGGVGGGRTASYAMNLIPNTVYPADARQRIEHRLRLREEIFYEKTHEAQ
jgi:hypothetical protein